MTVDVRTIRTFASLRLLSPCFFAQKVDKQASNSLLRTQIALRVDLGRSIFAELAKIKVLKRPNGWSLTIYTSSRERAIALAIEICVDKALWQLKPC